MTKNNHMSGTPTTGQDGTYPQHSSVSSNSIRCAGDCLDRAQAAFDAANQAAKSAGVSTGDLTKRFQFLRDVTNRDRHQEAEIMLEHALALYESVHGQEHPAVAQMLLDLATLYRSHGNDDYAQYLSSWANDIMQAHRIEPTHEFFHLFGWGEDGQPQEEQR